MARILRNLRIDEVSMVDKGAGENCRVLLYKWHGDDTPPHSYLMFNDVIAKADLSDPLRGPREHSKQGRSLPSRHTTKGNTAMPQIDVLKLIAITEDAMMAQARLDKRVDADQTVVIGSDADCANKALVISGRFDVHFLADGFETGCHDGVLLGGVEKNPPAGWSSRGPKYLSCC
jgi:hypothetical protein